MKERYAFVKFRPFSKSLYTYSCNDDVRRGNVVLVNATGTNCLQEALVAKIRYLHPWELPVEITRIKPVIAIKHKTADNTLFCEKLEVRYAFTPNMNIEKHWVKDYFYYDGKIENCSFSARYRYCRKNSSAYIDIFSNKNHGFFEVNIGNFEDDFCLCELIYYSNKFELAYMLNRIKIGIDKFYNSRKQFGIDELKELLIRPNDKPVYW